MRVEILGELEQRRRWSQADKGRSVEETLPPGRESDGGRASQRGSGDRGIHLASAGSDGRTG